MEIKLEYLGVPLTVTGEFIEGEDMEMYDGNLTGYPGSPDTFNIEGVFVEGANINILELLVNTSELEQQILERL